MPWITDAELKTSLAGVLKLAGGSADLSSFWNDIITYANNAAYGEVLTLLVKRGFSKAQADTWLRRAEYNRRLGLWWALHDGGGLNDANNAWVKEGGERAREELKTIDLLTEAGANITPANASGLVGRGSFGTGQDLFSLDPDDDRIGEVTRF